MKRIVSIVVGFVLCVGVLFALLILLLPREALKARIGEQIASWTGREVSLRGEPEVDVFPTLSVTLNDVHVSGPEDMADAEIISMDRLTGTIRLLPLLIGRVEIGSFTMVRPLVHLVQDAEGRRNWAFDSGAAALQLAFAGDVPLGAFHLEGGTVVYENRVAGESERLDSMNLVVEWTSVRHPIAIEGSGIWRGEQVAFSARAEAPFAFMNGATTPFDARIDSAPIAMIFSGEARDYPDPTLSGPLKLTTPSLRRFAAWLGSPVGPGSTLGQASIFGTAAFHESVLSVENAEFTLDGNAASGALRFEATDKKPDVTGTLAFNSLDLTPYFAGLSSALSAADDWRTVQLPTTWFGDLTADIRLSADAVTFGAFAAGDTAASVSLRDRRLEIGLARAVFNGGSLTGGLAVLDRPNAAEATVEAQMRATDISFAAAAPLVGGQPVSGTASASLDIATAGRDLGTLVGRLGGTGHLVIRDGAVPLFGIAEVAAGGSTRPSDVPFAPVPVESVSLDMTFSSGMGLLDRASIVTPSYSATAHGSIGLLDGRLGLNGVVKTGAADDAAPIASDAPDAAESEGGEPPTFRIEGTLAEPVATPLALAN